MQGAPKEDSALKEAQARIAPGDSVITVKGACSDPAKKGETCETVVTREQFEKLAEALQPNMATPIKLRLATAYSRLIGMSQRARQARARQVAQVRSEPGLRANADTVAAID
jgi:hypothetical protein